MEATSCFRIGGNGVDWLGGYFAGFSQAGAEL